MENEERYEEDKPMGSPGHWQSDEPLPEEIEPEVKKEVQLPRGYVQIAQADQNGNPIPGTEFNTSEESFKRIYEKRGFVIKKKAKN